MKKLALSDDILLKIEKPARYLGNEVNHVVKDPKGKIRFAMCFPDVYEIGMSHLGIQILYDLLNAREDVYCERVYSPWMDLDAVMREKKIPLYALESQDPIKDFDFLGITIQYEMCLPIFCRYWILAVFRCWHQSAVRMIPLSLAAVHVPIIRNLWQTSLIFFISERARRCMIS